MKRRFHKLSSIITLILLGMVTSIQSGCNGGVNAVPETTEVNGIGERLDIAGNVGPIAAPKPRIGSFVAKLLEDVKFINSQTTVLEAIVTTVDVDNRNVRIEGGAICLANKSNDGSQQTTKFTLAQDLNDLNLFQSIFKIPLCLGNVVLTVNLIDPEGKVVDTAVREVSALPKALTE